MRKYREVAEIPFNSKIKYAKYNIIIQVLKEGKL
jgi:hypothetical protein